MRTETVNSIEINSHLTKVGFTKMLHELYFFAEGAKMCSLALAHGDHGDVAVMYLDDWG